MIIYKNGTKDERKVLAIYNVEPYHGVEVLMMNNDGTTSSVAIRTYSYCMDPCDPIYASEDNTSSMEKVVIDAPFSQLTHYVNQRAKEEQLAYQKEHARSSYIMEPGMTVSVYKGRKYSKGTTFLIEKTSRYTVGRYGGNYILYLQGHDAQGNMVYVQADNCEIIDFGKLPGSQYDELLERFTSVVFEEEDLCNWAKHHVQFNRAPEESQEA